MPSSNCSPVHRRMYTWEIQEAGRVFGSRLKLEQVQIHECANWPNLIDRVGRWLRQMPAPTQPNAITLGYHLHFPVRLPETLIATSHPEHHKIGWLIHELTHSWQYEQLGWSYLLRALTAQFQHAAQAYDFGGESGLKEASQNGKRFLDFNPEQQGEICRTYYNRLAYGLDVSPWQPFINALQNE